MEEWEESQKLLSSEHTGYQCFKAFGNYYPFKGGKKIRQQKTLKFTKNVKFFLQKSQNFLCNLVK